MDNKKEITDSEIAEKLSKMSEEEKLKLLERIHLQLDIQPLKSKTL